MAVKTTQQLLEDNQAAIDLAEAAQAHQSGGRSHQMALLETLYEERARLRQELAREQGTTVGRATFGRRGS